MPRAVHHTHSHRRHILPSYPPHYFAGNPLDRGEVIRRSATDIARHMTSSDTRVVLLRELDPLTETTDDSTKLALLSPRQAASVCRSAPRTEALLGTDASGTPIAAWNIAADDLPDPSESLAILKGAQYEFTDARAAAEMLPRQQSGILAQAKANLDWHQRHRHCARCGNSTSSKRGGHVRQCQSCNAEHFPRTDPVVISLVTHGDKCLLGQSAGRLRSMRMYSALAGFMDQGESMEEAVRREVMEEAGIRVGEVRYHSSQPWPFPSSLMIGSHSQALTTEIDIDEFEMTDVRWFHRSDVISALNHSNPDLRVPGPIAIAHHLIKAWAQGDAGNFGDESA